MSAQEFAVPIADGLQKAHNDLLGSVTRFQRRIRIVQTTNLLPRAVATALFAALVGQLVGLRLDSTSIGGAIAVLGAFASITLLVWRLLKAPEPRDAALAFDLRVGLKERVSTAMELVDSPHRFELTSHQITDAAKHASAVRISRAYPFGPSRADLTLAFIVAALLAAWNFLPRDSGIGASITSLFEPPAERLEDDVTRLGESELDVAPRSTARLTDPTTFDRLRGALDQLRRSSNPEADALRELLQQTGESLRQTRPARDVGRRLTGQDYEGAAEALRTLSESLDRLNTSERQELIEGLRDASDITSDDPVFSSQFADAADDLENFRDKGAAENMREIAERIQDAGGLLASEESLQQRIADLERALRQALADGGGPSPSEASPDSGGDTQTSGGDDSDSSDLSGELGLTSSARGSLMDDLEEMGLETRLDAAGNLEIVEIEANEQAPSEDFERPTLQLGRDVDVSLNPLAGKLGTVRSRRDSSNQVPLDVASVVSRYFSPAEGE